MTESTSPGATDPPGARLIYRGAEADVFEGNWQGLDAIFKVRKPLRYRLAALDDAIRRMRTVREAQVIHEVKKAGVASPFIYDVDVVRSSIVMERVRGDRLRDVLDNASRRSVDTMFEELGRSVALIHRSGVMHGDLTTANVMKRNGGLVFLDFGLAAHTTRVEDHAVDLRLIKETLTGAHPGASQGALAALLRGYGLGAGGTRSKEVLGQLRNIERRGRYARVV